MIIGSDGEMAEIAIRSALEVDGGAMSATVFLVVGILAVFVRGQYRD